MANSYTVYVRYPNENTHNKCKPIKSTYKPTTPQKTNIAKEESSNGGGVNIGGIVNAVKNPMSALTGNARTFPIVASAMAIAKVAEQIVETAIPFYTGYTGDYRVSMNYANLKAAISAIKNPYGTIMQYATRQMEVYRQNLKTTQERMLTGNSIINTYGGKTSN